MKAVLALIFLSLCAAETTFAGVFELGSGWSYRRSSYNSGSYTSMTSWSASLGYFFTQDSEVEFLYQDSSNSEYVPSIQDLQYRDRVYSLNFVYHILPEGSSFRPFFRAGLGQLNRDATGTYFAGSGNYHPPGRLDQVTVIGGIGFKARLTSQVGLKAEATSYLTGGSISTWQDNVVISVGGSIYF